MSNPYPTPPAPQPAPKKHRKWPWVLGGIVALFILVGVAGGGDDSPAPVGHAPAGAPAGNEANDPAPAEVATERTVIYKVIGTGTASSITYTTDGMTSMNQESDVTLPWEKTIKLPTGEAMQMVQLSAQGSGSGTIDVVIEVDGEVYKEAHADGYGIASANGNIGSLG